MASGTEPTLPVPDLRLRREHPVVEIGGDGSPSLIGSRCGACGTVAVPARFVCGACGSDDVHRLSAGAAGELYSFSTVHVSSSRPTPYTLGYVDLDNGARVLATVEAAGDDLAIGSRVRLVASDDRWAFTPEEEN